MTVIGSGMSADGLTCRFGEAQVREQGVRWQTSTSAACVVPPYPAAAGGMVMVELSNNGGSDFTAAGAGFMYQASVSVVSVRPSRALAGAEGQIVTVIGQNFGAGDTMCLFGKSAVAPARIVSSTSLVCLAPVHNTITDTDTGRPTVPTLGRTLAIRSCARCSKTRAPSQHQGKRQISSAWRSTRT